MSGMLRSIAAALEDVIRPLERGLSSAPSFEALLYGLGWNARIAPGSIAIIQTAFAIQPLIDQARVLADEYDREGADELAVAGRVLDALLPAIERLRTIAANPPGGLPFPLDQSAFWNESTGDLTGWLFTSYFERSHPVIFAVLLSAGVIDIARAQPGGTGRVPFTRHLLRWDRLPRALADPVNNWKDVYSWGRTGEPFQYDKLLRVLERCALAFELRPRYQYPRLELRDAYYPQGGAFADDVRRLSVPVFDAADALGYVELGLELMPIPAKAAPMQAPTGLMLTPVVDGEFGASVALGRGVSASLHGGFESGGALIVELRPDGVALASTLAAGSVDAEMALIGNPQEPWILAGEEGSHRLELSGFILSLGARGPLSAPEIVLALGTGRDSTAGKLTAIVQFREGDGFLQKILGDIQRTFEFAGGLAWSSKRGLTFEGQDTLEIAVGIRKSIGFIYIDSLYLGITAPYGNVAFAVAASGNTKLGPVTISVDRVGLRLLLEPRRDGDPPGNFGDLDIGLGFKPPSGAGLSIDAGPIVGGGYLFFDVAKEEYAGVLQLEFQETISLTAIGLLTTRMPDGSKGFSLLIIISAGDFVPIPLGYGFTLNGVGGLLGVNRTVVVDVLRAGIKNRTLDSVLFPDDPVRNAPQIISQLRAVFPPAERRYVFGPMAIIGWGTPTMVTIELALVLEVPAPVRLVMLGQVRAVLPDPVAPLITLQMDALGVIAFDTGDAAVDATLYDSRLIQYVLTGEMALRANWGASPTFVLAVGGLHPGFQPPPAFPPLDRIAVSLATGDNPRLRLESYLALTSNTAQIGARLEVSAKQGGFRIEGWVGFDALFQFEPFQFVADVGGRVVVRRGGTKITSVGLDMTLTGPKPWHAWGKAKFEVLSIKHAVRFEARFGEEGELPRPAAVDVGEALRAAARDVRNWSGALPEPGHPLVSVRPGGDATRLRVHPQSELVFRQRVVPLNVTISKFGNTAPSGERAFALREVTVDGREVTVAPVTEPFAPAQFFAMSDAEKLSRPSFEPLEAGLRVRSELTHDPAPRRTPIVYETIVVDPKSAGPAETAEPYPLPAKQLPDLARGGAAGRAAFARSGRAKYRAAGPRLAVREGAYVVATTDRLKRELVPGLEEGEALTYTKAADALRHFVAAHPEQRGTLQVVRAMRG